jgi:phytoene dehydrogenase-like protein
MLLLGAADADPVATGWFAAGGPRGVADALAAAALAAGAEIRTSVEVARIEVADEAAAGVTLSSGETIAARTIVCSLDPKRTLLGLVDPMHLEPDFIRRVQNIRARGTLAKVNYALSSLPRFAGLSNRDAAQERSALGGRIRLARSMLSIERAFDAAKYGGIAEEPWIELTIPTVADPSLAPRDQHVVSAYVQYVPKSFEDRDRIGDASTRTIEQYAPGFAATVLEREVITPLDLERTYGLTSGHIFHGELALDQLFVARPLLGWARYSTPIKRLFLCGAGTHPGAGVNGWSGVLAARTVLRDLRR